MKKIKILNKYNNHVYGENVKIADSFYDRLKGLMFVEEMEDCDGLIIEPCNSIHTFFMRFKIDVLFLDSSNRIIQIYKEMPPWRLTRIFFKASKVLELKSGTIPSNTKIGDQLEVICIN